MSMTFEVVADGDRPLVVKRADERDAARLQAEADRLRAASHPGVVQVVSSGPVGTGWELRMVHAGQPLEIAPEMPPARVAAMTASLATTLADLHASGIVHGRVDPSHVLVGPHGRPVLCGFTGDEARLAAVEPADDVAGVGSIMVALLGTEGEGEPIPERRWWPRGHWTGWERRALLTLADQACAEPASRRPSARRLAAAITDAVPAAVTSMPAPESGSGPELAPMEPAPAPDPLDALRASATEPSEREGLRPVAVLLAALGVATLVVGFHRSGPEPEIASDVLTTTSRPEDRSQESSVAPPTTTSRSIVPAGCGPIGGVDLDGDGCRERVDVDGRTIQIGSVRFVVGDEGDEVVVGDWDCDGESTPAVLRPATGEVFVFARWDPDADVVAEPAAKVAGGRELVVASSPEACSGLGVRTATAVVEIVRSPT